MSYLDDAGLYVAERPEQSEVADLAPARPPCGGRCSPEGCFSPRCWVDAPDDHEDEA